MEGVCSLRFRHKTATAVADRVAMKKTDSLLRLNAMFFALSFPAEAQEPKVYRVGENSRTRRRLLLSTGA